MRAFARQIAEHATSSFRTTPSHPTALASQRRLGGQFLALPRGRVPSGTVRYPRPGRGGRLMKIALNVAARPGPTSARHLRRAGRAVVGRLMPRARLDTCRARRTGFRSPSAPPGGAGRTGIEAVSVAASPWRAVEGSRSSSADLAVDDRVNYRGRHVTGFLGRTSGKTTTLRLPLYLVKRERHGPIDGKRYVTWPIRPIELARCWRRPTSPVLKGRNHPSPRPPGHPGFARDRLLDWRPTRGLNNASRPIRSDAER